MLKIKFILLFLLILILNIPANAFEYTLEWLSAESKNQNITAEFKQISDKSELNHYIQSNQDIKSKVSNLTQTFEKMKQKGYVLFIFKINNTGSEAISMKINNNFFMNGHQSTIDSGNKYWNIPLKISAPLFLTITAALEYIYFSFAPLPIEAKVIFSPVIIFTSFMILENIYKQSCKKSLSNNLYNYLMISKITPNDNTYLPVFVYNQNNDYYSNLKTIVRAKQFQDYIKSLRLSYNNNVLLIKT